MPTTTLDNSDHTVPRPPQNRPARVLYAEDLRELQHLMRLILRSEGYEIETVDDGDQALPLLTKRPDEFDLLITDHHMARMNGLELVRRLAGTGFRGKIMVFSSELDPAVHREYQQFGVTSILPKPVRPAGLRQVLRELLPASRA